MFDFLDMTLTGTEVEYDGRKYMYLKALNGKLIMAAEIGANMPATVVVIPSPTATSPTKPEEK
jgi:hypothetical protein